MRLVTPLLLATCAYTGIGCGDNHAAPRDGAVMLVDGAPSTVDAAPATPDAPIDLGQPPSPANGLTCYAVPE